MGWLQQAPGHVQAVSTTPEFCRGIRVKGEHGEQGRGSGPLQARQAQQETRASAEAGGSRSARAMPPARPPPAGMQQYL